MSAQRLLAAFNGPSAGVAVKFCGFTRAEDAEFATALGVEAAGLVFYQASSRAIDPASARNVATAIGPEVARVGVFVDPDAVWVEAAIAAADLDVLQFHGSETQAFCAGFGKPYLKAFRCTPGLDLARAVLPYADACAWLVDSYDPERPGGTGRPFDWTRLAVLPGARVMLAGGLTAENVGDAIVRSGAAAVDVSGGIESSPGVKDRQRMRRFVDAARAVRRVE